MSKSPIPTRYNKPCRELDQAVEDAINDVPGYLPLPFSQSMEYLEDLISAHAPWSFICHDIGHWEVRYGAGKVTGGSTLPVAVCNALLQMKAKR